MKKRSRRGPLFHFRIFGLFSGLVRPLRVTTLLLVFVLQGAAAGGLPSPASAWPGSLRDGLPEKLPGYVTAPKDPFPDTDENAMGPYTQVSRRYQRIEPSSAKVLVLLVQDYGKNTNLLAALRDAWREAGKSPGIVSREREIAGRKALVVVNRTGANPVTIVTVVVTPSRLLLADGDNLEEEETIKLLDHVDFARVAAATPAGSK
jgi:hypothetical protein